MATLEYRMHLLNIALSQDVVFSPSVSLRVMSEEELYREYPFDEARHGRPCFTSSHWGNHKVEAVIKLDASESEFLNLYGFEAIDKFERLFTHSHLLCCFDDQPSVYSTYRKVLVNGVPKQISLSFMHGYRIAPSVLDEHGINLLTRCFSLLCSDRRDTFLDRSIDRFLSGRKQDIQHPNIVNTPNWDKIVDYVVAMEALLLSGKKSDLTLRFKLNGAWLLSEAYAIDRKTAFVALGHLYNLRSSVVHGYDLVGVKKSAQRFHQTLSASNSMKLSELEIIQQVSQNLETWLQRLFFYLLEIPNEERPYICEGAWESMYLGAK
jgi:hypothetical protein